MAATGNLSFALTKDGKLGLLGAIERTQELLKCKAGSSAGHYRAGDYSADDTHTHTHTAKPFFAGLEVRREEVF